MTPASEQERDQVQKLAEAIQQITHENVKLAYVDQGYTGDEAEQAARKAGLDLMVIKSPEAKKSFVLLPRRRVVERSFAWATRFRRLARDFERAPESALSNFR